MNSTYAHHTPHDASRSDARQARHGQRNARATTLERVGLMLILCLLVFGAWVTSAPPSARVTTTRVLTAEGDTLWTIASRHPAPGLSTQQDADLIARLNGIRGGEVPAGRSIAVPASAYSPAVALR